MAVVELSSSDRATGVEGGSPVNTNKVDSDSGRGIDYNTPETTAYFLDDGTWPFIPPYDVKLTNKFGDLLDESGEIMGDFFMTQDDLLPVFEAQIVDQNGPVNLSGKTVSLIMAKDSTTKINAECTILSTAQGRVAYEWVDTDTDTPGIYIAVLQVLDGTNPQSFPSYRHLQIVIQESPAYTPILPPEE